MEVKKNPKYDLQNKRGLFLEVGLIVSVGLMILMFNYSQSEKVVQTMDLGNVEVEEEIIEITRQDQKPPEPVKQTIAVVSDIINVVKNETKITTNFDFSDFSEDAVVVKTVGVREEVTESDEPFIVAEQMPMFQGGDLTKFRSWVMGQIRYPQIAAENGISGNVVLSFVIEKDGTLTNITVLQSPDSSLAEEATRVLKLSPKWTPGKQRSSPVRVKYTLPVQFKIQN